MSLGSAMDPPQSVDRAVELGRDLVETWGSWGPTLGPDATTMAFVSDRTGVPEVYVAPIPAGPEVPAATRIPITDDPVVSVNWSADGGWLASAVATDGGVRTQVWVVRPDGTGARRIAGSREQHAELGPWTRSGHRVAVTLPPVEPGRPTRTFLADPNTGELTFLAVGALLSVLDMSVDEHLVVLRDGERGRQFCVVVDRVADADHPLLPYPASGATDVAILRPSPPGEAAPFLAYLCTDAGLPRRQLVAMPLGFGGQRGQAGVLAAREDAELEGLDANDSGRLLLLVWNVAGRSEIELLDARTGERHAVPDLPGAVVSGAVLSRNGRRVICAVEGPQRPRELWCLEVDARTWRRVSDVPELPAVPLVIPVLHTYVARDGLPLSGWLYDVPGRDRPGPTMLSLHGGPEAQERPAFSPQHQAMVAAGIAVFAPNIRGSSGFGRSFVHADDLHGRRDAFDDVLVTATYLEKVGIADPDRVAVTGRSYGGYLTLTSLAFSPESSPPGSTSAGCRI